MARKKNASRAQKVGAFQILEAITHSPRLIPLKATTKRNPDAVAGGRFEERKSGRARANNRSTQQQGAIALKAAKARWKDRR
jgi:hypothetical protein